MSHILPLGIAAIALASYVVYAAAIQWFFTRPDGVQSGMRVVSVCGTFSGLVHLFSLYSRPAPHGLQVLGLVCHLGGLGLFVWAWNTTRSQPLPLAFSRIVPDHIVSNGPYAWLRHPFYTAYSMTWIGGALSTSFWLAWLTAISMIGLYVWAATVESRFFTPAASPAFKGSR